MNQHFGITCKFALVFNTRNNFAMQKNEKKPYKKPDQKSTIVIKFNITPSQLEKFNAKVESSNLTISSYIRQKIGLEPK